MTIGTPSSESVTADVEMRILLDSGLSAPMPCTFTYGLSDPFAVSAAFRHSDGQVVWVFARELLRQGLVESAGEGDIQVRPVTIGGRALVQLTLSSPGGRAVLHAQRDEVASFLLASQELLPEGDEWRHLNFDSGLAEMLGDNS